MLLVATLSAPPALDGVSKIAVFLITLSFLVVLHEFGHYLLARRNGVKVNDFAVGFGPTVVKWTSPRTGTNYRLNLLPLGGYCAMQGEDGQRSEAAQQREFQNAERFLGAPSGGGGVATSSTGGAATAVIGRPRLEDLHESSREFLRRREALDAAEAAAAAALAGTAGRAAAVEESNFQAKRPWQRLSIVVAGPLANFVLAFAILVVSALAFGIPSDHASPVIGPPLRAGFPAERAGLRIGDRITAINGVPIRSGAQLVRTIRASAGRPIRIAYARDGRTSTVTVRAVPIEDHGQRIYIIGFSPLPMYERVAAPEALAYAATGFQTILVGNVEGVASLVVHPSTAADQVSGPVGMARAGMTIQDFGWGPYFQLAAMISIALGIFNLLPIPALDGGRAVFIVAEMLRGKPVDPEKEALVHVAGFALLMAFIIFVTYHDIAKIVAGKGVF